MHLHLGELLLAGIYMAAAVIVLVAIFRSHPPKRRDYQLRTEQPKREADQDKRDAA